MNLLIIYQKISFIIIYLIKNSENLKSLILHPNNFNICYFLSLTFK